MVKEYKRPVFNKILKRIREKRNFIQILAGPRQVGKTILARQIINDYKSPVHYASADEPTLRDNSWLNQQWDIARLQITEDKKSDALLILDEVQKITGWSETVKRLWDEDTINKINLKVILLGSSPLLMQKGLTESLGGRFETIPVAHWSFAEMQDRFNIALEKYIYFGGYPGAMQLTGDTERWKQYIINSLIETTISRDILLMTRVDKPALLRRLFYLGCQYSGQVLSYQKMTGQLQDAGNTTTLAHYLELLNGAGLLSGLNKYSGKAHRKRSSSPKLLVLNTALMSALSGFSYKEAIHDRQYWGRLTETAVGAHLVNDSKGKDISVYYWLNRNKDVDYVLESGDTLVAIEVKSGKKRNTLEGMEEFCRTFKVKRQLLVGQQRIAIGEFLASPIEKWMK
ncbi:MAG: ATP-binding protein [Actinobacteria bacterium]|nr:ATP-binding protein [Actinomycetota bacterium]